MFFRAKKSGSKNHPHEYLQIVESFRDGSTVRQRVIATLGRLDHLKASGHQQLDLIFLDTTLPAGRQALPTPTGSAPSGPDVLGRNGLSYSHRF